MSKREDGKKTRDRLLNAAVAVFAEKGYRNAKVAEICRRAGANVASVNYYFGDKASLYVETWRHAFENAKKHIFSAPESAEAREKFRSYILAIITNYAEKSQSHFIRLYLMEMINPTGLVRDAWREMIRERMRPMRNIIRELIGPNATEEKVLFCELSIASQCRSLLTFSSDDLEFFLGQSIDSDLARRLADHIFEFSMAGIEAAAQKA